MQITVHGTPTQLEGKEVIVGKEAPAAPIRLPDIFKCNRVVLNCLTTELAKGCLVTAPLWFAAFPASWESTSPKEEARTLQPSFLILFPDKSKLIIVCRKAWVDNK